MSDYTHTEDTQNEIPIKLYARTNGTFSRNVPRQFISKPLRRLSKHQRHYRCRTVGKLHPTIQLPKGTISMKTILNSIWSVLVSVGEARHAAFLARQGKVAEAKALYGQ